ncbi:hypothetical protein QLQ77_gp41 [Gordonia phage Reyja]|uniref:Uncharacterized protein n=1 Tax=Gordonia phage Reyja TaxID=2571250 RepID=A0A4D6TAI5_9CAUD|nr:hypothetical protein QLQ77_gp41 [Gordonia phage Reyja]QCG77787.1 hypothetical protein SEA_REYJA_41 [Gordonia phage Reyja]
MTAPLGDAGGLLDLDPVAAGLRAVDEVVTEIRAFGYGSPTAHLPAGFVRLAEADQRVARALLAARPSYRFLGEL